MSIRPPATELDAENETALAQRALDEGDAARALHHAALALSRDPMHTTRRALFSAAMDRIPDPIAATELPVEPSYIQVATRAYVFAARAQWIEALALAAQAVKSRPDAPYLSWALSWLQIPGVSTSLDDHALFPRVLAPLLRGLPKVAPKDPTDPVRRNTQLARAIASVLSTAHPHRANLAYAESAILRKLGSHEDAVFVADRAYSIEPSFLTCVGRAAAMRDAGNVEGARVAYEEAAGFDPKDESVWIDIGDMLNGASRFGEAASAFEHALTRAPHHAHARAALYYARFRATGNAADRDAIQELRDLRPFDDRLRVLADEIAPPFLYNDVLPTPADGSVRTLARALLGFRERRDLAAGSRVLVSTTYPESPSAILAFKSVTRDLSPPPEVALRVLRVQYPDPRTARTKVDFTLWEYDDMNARIVAPAPDPRVPQAIATIARMRFDIEAWDDRATQLGIEMGPAWAVELACAMVHPPPVEDDRDPFDWLFRVQVAAALVIARVEKTWENSARKRVLYTLCRGPADWSTAAAVIALGQIAKRDEDPEALAAIAKLFSDMRAEVSTSGYTAYELPLACTSLEMPGISEMLRRDLVKWRDSACTRHYGDPEGDGPPSANELSEVSSREVESIPDETSPESEEPTLERLRG